MNGTHSNTAHHQHRCLATTFSVHRPKLVFPFNNIVERTADVRIDQMMNNGALGQSPCPIVMTRQILSASTEAVPMAHAAMNGLIVYLVKMNTCVITLGLSTVSLAPIAFRKKFMFERMYTLSTCPYCQPIQTSPPHSSQRLLLLSRHPAFNRTYHRHR